MSHERRSREGERVPDVTFETREDGKWKSVTTHDLFGGKTVVAFALPGAFTPTCSSAHVPRYHELRDRFTAAGVDDVLCFSVNDAFVMDAWKKEQGADDVTFVPDGNGEFAQKMGMLVDKDAVGFGQRSWRYSMLVNDGVIQRMFVEPDEPGDPFTCSDADTMLKHLGGDSPDDVVLFTKPGCAHCARAKKLLDEKRIPYAELPTSPRILRALPGAHTTPQVFVNGQHVGGADDLEKWLASRG